MYGSSLMIETDSPRLLSSRPMLAAVMPLPSEEVTPPVTKTYFAIVPGPRVVAGARHFRERASTDANATLGKSSYHPAIRCRAPMAPPPCWLYQALLDRHDPDRGRDTDHVALTLATPSRDL